MTTASHLRFTVGLLALLPFLTGCGGGGSAAAAAPVTASPTVTVTTYYDPGTQLFRQASGPVLVGGNGAPTTTKQGLWTTWYPPAQGNTKQFEKTYVADAWDTAQYWREWNADTSLRFDWSDR